MGVMAIGAQQPLRAVYQSDHAIFVALKDDRPHSPERADLFAQNALWRTQSRLVFVGGIEPYWTDLLLLPPGADVLADLEAAGLFADAYVARVELWDVPTIFLGLVRAQHLVGITKRPQGSLPTALDQIGGRPEVMPTIEAIEAALALSADTPITMMNFLEYFPTPAGDKERG